ncbi:MAG: hypothetical protein FDX30_03855 [Chlorobium sp.]|nr:MAG: hypothetical protein FDX30_03855 [Chlorobium sp.]
MKTFSTILFGLLFLACTCQLQAKEAATTAPATKTEAKGKTTDKKDQSSNKSTAKNTGAKTGATAPAAPKTMGTTEKTTAGTTAGPLHGNTGEKVFHKSTCRFYNSKNSTVVFKTREEAIKAGYKPCKICKP